MLTDLLWLNDHQSGVPDGLGGWSGIMEHTQAELELHLPTPMLQAPLF